MGNSTTGGGQDCTLLLQKFRDADAAYQSAPPTEKEHYFPRRHAALMMVLGIPPRTRNEIAEVMSVALDELAKELLVPGPVPEVVAAALTNCLRAIEDIDLEPRIGPRRSIELTATVDAPSAALVDLDSEIEKLKKLAGLLSYLADNSGGKEVQSVFSALMSSVEAIQCSLSAAVDKLMSTTPMTRTA